MSNARKKEIQPIAPTEKTVVPDRMSSEEAKAYLLQCAQINPKQFTDEKLIKRQFARFSEAVAVITGEIAACKPIAEEYVYPRQYEEMFLIDREWEGAQPGSFINLFAEFPHDPAIPISNDSFQHMTPSFVHIGMDFHREGPVDQPINDIDLYINISRAWTPNGDISATYTYDFLEPRDLEDDGIASRYAEYYTSREGREKLIYNVSAYDSRKDKYERSTPEGWQLLARGMRDASALFLSKYGIIGQENQLPQARIVEADVTKKRRGNERK